MNTTQNQIGQDLAGALAKQPFSFVTLLVAIFLTLLSSGGSSHAASDAWDGSTDGVWAISGNWLTDPGVVPGAGDMATFNGAGNGNTTIDLGVGVTISNVVFDTASAAAYTIGSGAVGSQTLLLDNLGGMTLNPGVANDQLISALLSLPSNTNANTSIRNLSSSRLTLAGGISAIPTNGNSLLYVTNSGDVAITGVLTETGAGSLALLKAGSGTLTISTNTIWSGTGALGRVPATSIGNPLVAREGTLLFNGGSNFVNGELVVGGVVADGGPGQSAKLIVNAGSLNCNNWLSIGRGNGIGGALTEFIASNNAVVTTVNMSGGFNGNNGANFPRASLSLNDSSVLSANGSFYIGETSGSDFTVAVNGSAALTNVNAAGIRVSSSGKGNLLINGGTVVTEGDLILNFSTSGATNGSRVVLNGGNLHVSGSLPASTAERWLIVKRTGNSDTDLVVSNGTIHLNNQTDLRFSTQDANATGSNTVTIFNGAIIGYSDRATTVGGNVQIDMQRNGGAATINTFNLNGGMVTVRDVISTVITGTRIFNFNGGTLRPNAATANFVNLGAGSARANVRNGGAVIDSDGKDITIVQTLEHSDVPGDNATDGGLTKLGGGTLTLAGGANYTGTTMVKGGTLILPVGNYPGGIAISDSSLFANTATISAGGSLTVSNGTLNLDVSPGTSLAVASAVLRNSASLTLNFGALSGNPINPGLNVTGSLTAPGTAITINVAGIGFQPGTFTLIDYTGAALPNLANFTAVLPPGVSATLNNNTANTSIDLVITTAPQNLTWYGTNANWDVNTTFNFNTATLKYLEYGSGASAVGDAVRFDDTLFNDNINPQNTNVNLTTALRSFPVTVDSILPYTFSGPGQFAGVASIVKSNTGVLSLTTSNSHTGGTLIYGGAVGITNENQLGAVAGKLTLGGGSLQVNANATNTTRAISVVGASTLGVASGNNYQVGGVISGAGNLNKIDAGTMILTGSNGITGNLTVDQGTVRSTGNQTLPAVVRVGNTASQDGVLAVSGGTFRASNNGGQFTSSLIAGGTTASAGSIILSGGTLSVMQQLGLGAGQGGYGAFSMSSGTLACGSYIVVGFNNDRAVYNQTAGTVTISSNLMTIAAGGTGSIGVANVSGGTFTSSFGTSSGIMVGERGIGTLNVSGAAVINVPTNAGVTVGPVAAQTGWDGTLNLNGGTITANRVVKGLGTGTARVNFNGGTLRASTGNSSFLSGMDSATVYSGGASFDDGGFGITVPQALQAPTDFGVSSISLASGGSGYIDSPIVTITGGSGSNATATATVAGGVVTAVTVTARGTGYGSGDILSVTFDGGGAVVTPAAANNPVLVANVSGGLIKRGNGTLNLTGANTYSGSNFVSAGTLLLAPAHQAGGVVTVASNAAFGALANTVGNATVGNVNLGSTALDRTTLSIVLTTGSNPTSPVLQCGTLTVNGTNIVRLSGTLAAGTFPILQYSGTPPTVAHAANAISPVAIVPQGMTAIISNDTVGLRLYAIVSGVPGIVWTGTNSVALLTNVWNLNSATNWLAAGVPSTYQETAPPGDPVTFNDIGSGVVLLSNTVSPGSVTISNNAKSYAFSGTGRISGTAGVTKQGTGTVTMNLAGNDYSGSTTVSAGTLQLGTGTTIPDGATAAGVSVGASGRLDMAGFSETINGLSGSGVIDNSSGTAATLTIGNGNSGGSWAGLTTNSSGTVTFLKVGTGALTLSGTNYLGGTSQFNGGTNTLTGTGRIESIGTGEFWVQQNAGSSTFIVNGGSISVNNWLVVGRNAAAANGTLILNSGTITKTGGGNIVVGSLNATGLLVVNGGQILNNSMLWLGENASANATLQLNGGLIQATQVRPNNAVLSSIANFNGGILQASAASADFIQSATAANIQSGGLILDSQNFAVTVANVLAEDGSSPGGGLVKLGSGVLALTGANSYSGLTTVSNGTLRVDGSISGAATVKSGATLGGIGNIGGVVTVEVGGTLAAGDSIGNLTLASSPVLNGAVVAEVDRNDGVTTLADRVTVSGLPITYGGTLVLTNTGVALQVGDTFKVFDASSYSGSFTLISQTPMQTVTWNTSNLTLDGTISVATATSGPSTTPTNIVFSTTGNTLNLSWPASHLGWTLQTNAVSVANPASWFAYPGSTAVTSIGITINPSLSNVYFRLVLP